jgi:hypothetical protein
MKKKLQSLNDDYAQKQSIQTMKPVFQFPIPPLNLPTVYQSSASSSPSLNGHDRRDRDNSEPIPKRIRLDESESEDHHHNSEAQNSDVIDNNNNVFITV